LLVAVVAVVLVQEILTQAVQVVAVEQVHMFTTQPHCYALEL
jgi:hypothetical protein